MIESVTLQFVDLGINSDKVYKIELHKENEFGLYEVITLYGRRGSQLRFGKGTSRPVSLAAAREVFNARLREKRAGGYTVVSVADRGKPAGAEIIDSARARFRDAEQARSRAAEDRIADERKRQKQAAERAAIWLRRCTKCGYEGGAAYCPRCRPPRITFITDDELPERPMRAVETPSNPQPPVDPFARAKRRFLK